MVRHKGIVIAFAMDAERRIWYTMLDVGSNGAGAETAEKNKSVLDVDAWQSTPTELIFPNEIAKVGFGVADQTILPTFKINSSKPEVEGTALPLGKPNEYDYFRSTTARFTEGVPFQVMSDGRYVYVFRQAIGGADIKSMIYIQIGEDGKSHLLVNKDGFKGYVKFNKNTKENEWVPASASETIPLVNASLLVDRFMMVGNQLVPKMEVRYQRSRSKTRPASRKDSLGSKDLDGNIFYEPTQELKFIANLKGGHFSVLMLPTAIAEIKRWQIFAENGVTGRMDSYNVECSSEGLFNTRGTQTYTCQDHPELYTRQLGTCPQCGRPLIPRIVNNGYSESALEFSNNGDRIVIPKRPELNFSKAVTVEIWIKFSEMKGSCFIGKGDKDLKSGYLLRIDPNGTPAFAVSINGVPVEAVSKSVIKKDTWYHLAGSFDGSKVRLFINGEETRSTDSQGAISPSGLDFNIEFSPLGLPSNQDANLPLAIIDEMRLWKRARSSAELKEDMHHRLTGLESDLEGYWRFDEGNGSDIHDQTNNMIDGTISGAEWISSDAPVGEHPGIERTSFEIKERSFKSAPSSLLYYQQNKAASGYSDEEKPLKNTGRVMLAVATNDSVYPDKKNIAALDFSISPSGRLAQIPDSLELGLLNPKEIITNESINETLDKIAVLESQIHAKEQTVDLMEKNLAGAIEWKNQQMRNPFSNRKEIAVVINNAEKNLKYAQKALTDHLAVIQSLKSLLTNGVSVTMPRVHTDSLGLTTSGGLLGFAWTDDAPLLFDSATGSLALYFRGKDDQFFVAYYDTFAEHAMATLLSDGKDAVSCFSISTAYDKIFMEVGDDKNKNAAACTVSIFYGASRDDFEIKETWNNVPRTAQDFSSILNGQATTKTYIGSGQKTKSGELTLLGPGAQRAVNNGAILIVGVERVKVGKEIFRGDRLIQFEGPLGATESLPIFYIEYDYHNATCEGTRADLSSGSMLIRAITVGDSKTIISNTDPKKPCELVPSLVCKWTAAAPGSTVSFDGKKQLAEADANNLNDFDPASDLTLEAWTRPMHIEGKAQIIKHYSSSSNYLLALEKDSPLQAYKIVAGVGGKLVKTREKIYIGNWTHLAAAFHQAYGLEFDGDDNLNCGNNTTLDINQDLTIEAFLQITTLNRQQVIIRRGMLADVEADQHVPYSLSLNTANQLEFAFEDVNQEVHKYTSGALTAGFHKVAVTRKRIIEQKDKGTQSAPDLRLTAWDEINFYVDGAAYGSAKYESSKPDTDKSRQPVDVGNSNKPVIIGESFKGVIAEVRVWNTARDHFPTPDGKSFVIDARDIFASINGNEKGLVSWWRFSEGKGNKAFDSKSQNHAIITGAQWVKSPDEQASSLKLYINGQLEETEALKDPTELTTPVPQFVLGARKSPNANDQYFQGELEEVRIWQTARTQEQIQDNLFRRIQGEKEDLIACYTFDDISNEKISDYSLRGNHLKVRGGANNVLSTAPIGEDTPQVRSALAGIRTPFSGIIGSTPGVQEYADMQYDGQGNLIGVLKRCYSFILNGKWQIITGYKVGDMMTEWVGQVQFAPQLIGFIEGAPPVPSENMTAHSADGSGDIADYKDASKVELVEAEQTTYTYASSRDQGFDMNVDFKLGFMIGTKANVGFGLVIQSVDVENIIGLQAQFEHSSGWLEDASTGISRTTGKSTSLTLRGRMPTPVEAKDDPIGRHFMPDNVGLALVKSETADVFALRLRHNGALISFQMRPNPDIPKDWNIIHFPINPRYTKQGTLDGKIGLKPDADYPNALAYSSDSSYFKPIEAYALKNSIKKAEIQLQAYFEQYAAGAIGRRESATHFSDQDLAGGRMLDKLPQLNKRNLVNTYVWTADGGLFSEATETMDSQEETIGGSYAFKGIAGLYTDLTLALFGIGAKFEANAMFGGHLNLTVNKTQASSSSFAMNISLDNVERDIYQRDELGEIVVDASDPKRQKPIKQPGKVNAYRFMSFYLEPQSDHFDDFFNLVVDPIWLEQSNDPSAVALRSARDDGKKPACWRILHRVTYVSRILPPLDLSAPPSIEKTLQTLDIDSNYELIKRLDPYVRDHVDDFADFCGAVDNAIETYLPELRPHEKEVKAYLSLYYGIDDGLNPLNTNY